MPRKRLLSDSERKRRKAAYNRKYYKTLPVNYHLHLKMDLNQYRRWNLVKEKLNVNTDIEVLNVLLDNYCVKEETVGLSSQTLPIPSSSITNTTSTPIIKTNGLLPYLSQVSSIQSSDSGPAQMSGVEMLTSKVKVEKSTLPTDSDLNQTYYDPHDITQDIKIHIKQETI